jgi:hypothetical protein
VIITLQRNSCGARGRFALFLKNSPWVRSATGITSDVDFRVRVVAPLMAT